MNRNETELHSLESTLLEKTFSQEDSTLGRVDDDFPTIDGHSFVHIIQEGTKSGPDFKLLELGGGISQRVASEIVEAYSGIQYFGLDKRPVKNDVASKLYNYQNFHFVQGGISELQKFFNTGEFSVIFAHNVGKHLPNPFYMLELAFPLLKMGGIFYTNHIPMYKEEWEKISKFYQIQFPGTLFSRTDFPPVPLLKAGIVNVSFAFKKTIQELDIPITISDDFIKDIEGETYDTREIFYAF